MRPEAETDLEITHGNLHAVQALHFAYTLEQARLLQVVDRIVELFRFRLLPLAARSAADRLASMRETSRLHDAERRNLYQRIFGAPGGDEGSAPNREFNDLWLRFVASVAGLARSRRTEKPVVANASARRAARDLASNLARAGQGLAQHAAAELARPIDEILNLLDDAALHLAFGAFDRWSLIERINANQFGMPIDSRRVRTMAESGSTILGWLAEEGGAANADNGNEVIDQDLIDANEQWLAASGLPNGVMEHYGLPIENSSSAPIDELSAANSSINSAQRSSND